MPVHALPVHVQSVRALSFPTACDPIRIRATRCCGLLATILLAVAAVGCQAFEEFNEPEKYRAKLRVEIILNAMASGSPLMDQKAICLWRMPTNSCDMNELEKAYDGFDRWLRAKNLSEGIQSHEIVDFWQDPESIDVVYFFHLKINGKNAYVRVYPRGGVEWAKKQEKPAAG